MQSPSASSLSNKLIMDDTIELLSGCMLHEVGDIRLPRLATTVCCQCLGLLGRKDFTGILLLGLEEFSPNVGC